MRPPAPRGRAGAIAAVALIALVIGAMWFIPWKRKSLTSGSSIDVVTPPGGNEDGMPESWRRPPVLGPRTGGTDTASRQGSYLKLERFHVEPDVLGPRGEVGVRATAHLDRPAPPGWQLIVRLSNRAGPLRAKDPSYTVAGDQVGATVQLSDGWASTGPHVAFIPYGALGLSPSDYRISVTPELVNERGALVATAPPQSFDHTAQAWRISAMRVTVDRQAIRLVAEAAVDPLAGGSCMLLVHFRNANGGDLLPGTPPYADSNGNLAVAAPFSTPQGRDSAVVGGLEMRLPLNLIPGDVTDLRPEATLFDPTTGRFLCAPLRFDITIPRR